MGYQNSTNAMMATIGDLTHSITVWMKVTTRLGEFVDGEDVAVTEKREENQHEMERVMKIIDHLNKLHDQVTKGMTNPDQCIIGFILHTNYWESVTGEVHLNTVKTSLTRTTVY